MRAISLFSGAGGFEIGFERAGIETILQAEKDPWALEVLARHWPDTERVTDVRAVGTGRQPGARRTDGQSPAQRTTVDLVYGGFPCQDVSVAGKRAGLSGERSGLWHEFHRVLRELRPRWTVIENVPGLLSSNQGRDFGTILTGLEELGYGWAYRILDARHFGVPQRRRRVFLVGCLGDAAGAAQVLAICEGCGGNPAPSREARQDIAPTLDGGARGTSLDLPLTAVARGLTSRNERIDFETENFIVAATQSGGGHSNGVNLPGRHHEDDENLVVAVASPDRASDGHHGHSSPRGDGADNLIAANGVRRLTPRECNRLQGFPDDWDRWTADGREIPDSHRYRLMGNAVCVPVVEYIGHRLARADAFLRQAEEEAA